jgi:alpha-ketoglutarate-dependent taurine dioxygenase
MLEELVTGSRVWEGARFQQSEFPRFQLDSDCLSQLRVLIEARSKDGRPLTEWRLADSPSSSCLAVMGQIRNTLDHGYGFVVIDNILSSLATQEQEIAAYWLLGTALGTPFKQNVKGDYLYSVRDMGMKVEQGVRPSTTAEESSFHTDYSFGDPHPDYVGLLCIRPAKEGGLSQLVNAWSVHNELLQRVPDELRTLYGRFYFDKRGEFVEGESPVAVQPVFDYADGVLTMRYMREYIRCGHEKARVPFSDQQFLALDTLDRVMATPSLRLEFPLGFGESLWINNRFIVHNRTAFRDGPDAAQKRHYLRMWVSRDARVGAPAG